MILVWHHIGKKPQDENTVSLKAFRTQLKTIKKSNCLVVPLAGYNPQNKRHVVLRFDDGCNDLLSVIPLLKKYGFVFEVFIVGDWFGRPGYLGPQEIPYILSNGGRLQWHSKTHADLTQRPNRLDTELKVPEKLKKIDPAGFTALAWPYWRNDCKTEKAAARYFLTACSGNGFARGGKYSLDGVKVTENLSFVWNETLSKLEIKNFSPQESHMFRSLKKFSLKNALIPLLSLFAPDRKIRRREKARPSVSCKIREKGVNGDRKSICILEQKRKKAETNSSQQYRR